MLKSSGKLAVTRLANIKDLEREKEGKNLKI